MKYKDGYKYQLAEGEKTQTNIKTQFGAMDEYTTLAPDGSMLIRRGYAWDGPTNPAIDTKNFMRGSLIHDALYQLMREGKLPIEHREAADNELVKACKEDGMWAIRRWWVLKAVRMFGGPLAKPESAKKALTAP